MVCCLFFFWRGGNPPKGGFSLISLEADLGRASNSQAPGSQSPYGIPSLPEDGPGGGGDLRTLRTNMDLSEFFFWVGRFSPRHEASEAPLRVQRGGVAQDDHPRHQHPRLRGGGLGRPCGHSAPQQPLGPLGPAVATHGYGSTLGVGPCTDRGVFSVVSPLNQGEKVPSFHPPCKLQVSFSEEV